MRELSAAIIGAYFLAELGQVRADGFETAIDRRPEG